MDMKVGDLAQTLSSLGPEFAERADTNDAEDRFVADNYLALKAARVFSAMVPRDLGGNGTLHNDMCAFIRGLAGYCPSTALALSMHQHLVAAAVYNHRNGKPGRKLLEAVAADEKVLVSTGAGDWLSSKGSMERVDGGYRVTARKGFGSGSPMGAILVTSAPYDHPEDGPQVLHFPVPLSAEGVTLANDWEAHGMRGTGSHTVILDGVFVPDDAIALSRPRGAYHPVWNVILTVAMPLIASAYVGIAEKAAEMTIEHGKKRTGDPVLPYLIGEMKNQLTIATLALNDMVATCNDWDFEPSTETGDAILTRKTLAVNAARATVEKALEATSGAGYFRRMGLERLLRDVTAGQFHPLPEKRQQHFTGRFALGLDPIDQAA